MTVSGIKQKPATRAGQCFEVSASALMVTIETEPPDSRIIKASSIRRNPIVHFRSFATRQGARSRTRCFQSGSAIGKLKVFKYRRVVTHRHRPLPFQLDTPRREALFEMMQREWEKTEYLHPSLRWNLPKANGKGEKGGIVSFI
jgi:hypothetical protein